ncbi:5'-3' exoribonuclease 2 [Cytospora paraplurivora]|uniref:5'-3' exoribonuclease n=1 Tax=Cytospora paraplurivora TaxID=2898453 RepID=A0AAN9TXA9_9PEZI
MGIPAAFRWLSTKYPKIVSPVIEDQPITMDDGTVIPVDTTRPNPNGEEFDNLYLDMNGIVHPCSHPEDRPPPKDEEEMMVEVFKYTDRVVNMVRPRKLLMIAVDGVAPRAKMNQQRSRRFRSAQDAQQKEEDKQQLITLLKKQNGGHHPAESTEEVVKKAFDSNSITPGTPFMAILAASLRYWCSYKLNTDPAWANVKVIISDATVPGEGEHKIMNFVRSQRSSPDHDPNTRHVIYGLDADLIMLGLATHEPHFRVLREDVFAQDTRAKMCKLCGQKGHDAQNCRGESKDKDADFDGKDNAHPLKPFIWLHVSVLREYLAVELDVPDLPFRWDIERAIDDWVFMCFFVGNDFLPHLPALEIRENGIDTLTAIWKDNLPYMGGFLTKDGHCDLERAQLILAGLAKQEDAIFRRRKETEDRREANFKRRKLNEARNEARNGGGRNDATAHGRSKATKVDNMVPGLAPGTEFMPISSLPGPIPKAITHDMVVNRSALQSANTANKSAASVLKNKLLGKATEPKEEPVAGEGVAEAQEPPASTAVKRKAEAIEQDGTSTPTTDSPAVAAPSAPEDEGPTDTVRLWEEGYTDRYYEQKFHVDPKDTEFRKKVAHAYVEGLAWVLMYYFQGCPSWEWYYPYHYAPFAQDFVELGTLKVNFEKGRISKPYEQLMSVLPAASRHAIPEVFHDLMTDEKSEIIDFYPEDFEVDLNGKKMAWQGVALLPFIDMPRLLTAMDKKYILMSEDELARNEMGKDVLIISDAHPQLYEEIITHFYSKKQGAPKFTLNPRTSDGLGGEIEKIADYLPHGSLTYPLERKSWPDIDYDRSLSAHTHKSMLLRGVKLPTPALDRNDIEELRSKARRSGRSYGGVPLGRGGHHQNGRNQQFNYGPGRGYHGGGRGSDRGPPGGGGYGGRDNYSQQHRNGGGYPAPPANWVPPPPGAAGFGNGLPPPPPPAQVYGNGGGYGGHGAYGGGYNQGYGNGGGYGAPPPAPGQYYGGGGGGGGGYQGQGYQNQGYRPQAPPGNDDRRYNGGHGGFDRGYGNNGGYRR